MTLGERTSDVGHHLWSMTKVALSLCPVTNRDKMHREVLSVASSRPVFLFPNTDQPALASSVVPPPLGRAAGPARLPRSRDGADSVRCPAGSGRRKSRGRGSGRAFCRV